MALEPLPPELWELICSYLPDNEVLRLLSLNSIFLSCALSIRYGRVSIRPCSDLKALLRPLKFPYVSGKVHTLTLRLCNNADQIPYSSTTRMLPTFALAQLRKWKRKSIVDSIRRLNGIYCLIMNYGKPTSIGSTQSYMDFAWKTFPQSLVDLDLRLGTTGLHHFASLDPSWVCPHVRILKLGIRMSLRRKASPILEADQVLFDSVIQRVSALIAPSPLVELICTKSTLHAKRAAPSIPFTKLRRIATSDCDSFPFDLASLLRENLDTLEDLDLVQLPDVSQRPLDWSQDMLLGPNLRRFVVHMRTLSHADVLSQLTNCHRLDSLELVESSWMWGDEFPKEGYQHIYTVMLGTLSMNCPSLTRLTLPFTGVLPPFFLDVIATFPNLKCLRVEGCMGMLNKRMVHFLHRFPSMEGGTPWKVLTFENLSTLFSSNSSESKHLSDDDYDDAVFHRLFNCATLASSRPHAYWHGTRLWMHGHVTDEIQH